MRRSGRVPFTRAFAATLVITGVMTIGTTSVLADEAETTQPEVVEPSNNDDPIGVNGAAPTCPSSAGVPTTSATTYTGKVVNDMNFGSPVSSSAVTFADKTAYETRYICVLTDATGSYSVNFPDAWKSTAVVKAMAPGGSNYVDAVLPASGTILNLSLGSFGCPSARGFGFSSSFATLSATVSTSAGSPVVGATIIAANNDFEGLICGGTSDSGVGVVTVPDAWTGVMLTVDPPQGLPQLGSSGRFVAVPSAQDIPVAVTLGPPGFAVSISASSAGGATVSANQLSVVACLYSSGSSFPIRCGHGRDSGSVSIVKISTDGLVNGMGNPVTASAYSIEVFGPTGEYRDNNPVAIGDSPLTLNRAIVLGSGGSSSGSDTGSDTGSGSNTGCANGASPNITGAVTNGGGAYASTSVELRVSYDTNPALWATNPTGLMTTTDASGNYGFCFAAAGNYGGARFVQVIAASKDRGSSATVGDSASQLASATSCSMPTACTLNVAMSAPKFRGVIANANGLRLKRTTSFMTQTLVEVPVAQNGGFAIGDVSLSAGPVTIEGFHSVNEVVPYVTTSAYSGVALPAITGTTETPNVLGDILKPDGTSFGQYEGWATIYLTKITSSCPGDATVAELFSNQCFLTFGQASGTKFAAKLADGSYALTAEMSGGDGSSYPRTIGLFNVSNSGASIAFPPQQTQLSLVGGRVKMRFSEGAMKFAVVRSGGASVSAVTLQANKWNGNWFDWVAWQPSSQGGGVFGWSPLQAGFYQLRMTPTGTSSGLSTTEVIIKVAVTNGVASITNTCTASTQPGTDPTCNEAAPSQNASGQFVLTMAGANFKAAVCGPSTAPACASSDHPSDPWAKPWVDVHQVVSQGGGSYEMYLRRIDFSNNNLEFRLDVPQSGSSIYKLAVNPPWGNPGLWSVQNVYVKITSQGVISRCTGSQSNPCATEVALTLTNGQYVHPSIYFSGAKVIGYVRRPAPSNQVVANSWMEVQQEVVFGSSTFYQYVTGVQTNGEGKFALNLTQGTYRFRANPPWDDRSGLSAGTINVKINANGDVSEVNGSPYNAESNPADVRLRDSNITGVVKAGSTPRSFVGLNVEKWNPNSGMNGQGQYDWFPQWGNTDKEGNFRINLDNGQWRLVAWPQGQDAGSFTEARVELKVAGGVLSEVKSNGSWTTVSASSVVELIYGSPNVKGTVKKPDGTGVGWGGVMITKFNPVVNFYEYVSWTNTSANGAYAINLAPGRYELSVEPPSNITGVVRTSKYLVVDTDNQECFVASADVLTCASDQDPLDITLAGPNVSGVVLAGGVTSSAQAWVTAEKWNGQWFEWQNKWADARPDVGTFGFVLGQGFYRVSAEPRSNGSGFAKGIEYIEVDGNGQWRVVTLVGGTPTCNSCGSFGSGTLSVNMPGANVAARATYNGTGLNNGWVEIFEVDESGNSGQWIGNTGLTQGNFSVRINPLASGTRRVRLQVTPATWDNPNNLGKKRVDLWVLQGSGTVCSAAPVAGACGGSTVSANPNSPFPIVMSAGNVSGTVTKPSGCSGSGCLVNQAEINVEKKTVQGGFTWYQWTDNWARTAANGVYTLNLDPGTYKVTARPAWGDSTWSPQSRIISVISSGGSTVLCEGDVGSCGSPLSNVNIVLAAPNVTGRVKNAGQDVMNAWIGIEKQVSTSAGTWWSWTGMGTNTNSDGKFSLNLSEAGEYRVVVQPPWNDSQGLVRFTQAFTVSCGGTCSSTLSNFSELSFPTSNVQVTVKDPSNNPLRDAWVYVEKQVSTSAGTWWQFADINGNSNASGVVKLRINEAGTYRLVVNPPWNKSDLPRIFDEFTMVDGGSGSIVVGDGSLAATQQFPAANVTGKVKIDNTTDNAFGWIEVRDATTSAYVTNTTANQVGNFALSLANGAYSLRFHPNYGLSSVLPINVDVTVSAGLVTAWKYASQASGTNNCSGSPCTVNPMMDFILPNLEVTVLFVSGDVTTSAVGAFVEMKSGGNSYQFVSGAGGVFKANVPLASYTVSVVWVDGASIRKLTNQSITVSGDLTTKTFVVTPNST